MNVTELFAMYERVSDAPDAVQKLRQFVLELAVTGRLVGQSRTEEPANLPSTTDAVQNENNDDVPLGWQIRSIGSLLQFQYGKGIPQSMRFQSGPVPVFGSNGIVAYTSKALTEQPSVIVGRKGSAGALQLCLGPSWATDVAYFVETPGFFDARFLALSLASMDLASLGKGVKPGLSRSDVYALTIAVPPLAEQHRIVAKVDELTALCDQLDAAHKEREVARDRLAAASFARLNAPDPDTFQADARFALGELPELSARPDQVKQLRQTILNLAVRGKLVQRGKTAQTLGARARSVLERPVDLPSEWEFEKLESLLSEDTRNGYSRRPDDAPDGTPILRISAGTVRRDGVVAEEEHKLISGIDDSVRKQYAVRVGDLLACRFNGNKSFVGRLTLFEDYLGLSPIYPDKLIRVRVDPKIALAAFIRHISESDLIRSDIEAQCATTVGNWGISASNLKKIRFPVPPLSEQHAIVSMLDELMRLCDQLEASLEARANARTRLLETLFQEALRADNLNTV